MAAHANSRIQKTRNAVLRIVENPLYRHLFPGWKDKPIHVLVEELLQKFTADQLCEMSEEIRTVRQESLKTNKHKSGFTNILGKLRDNISDPDNQFRKDADHLTTQKKNRVRAIVENEGDENPLSGARANLFDDEAPPAVATQAQAQALANPAVTPGPESNVITSTTTSTPAVEALAKNVDAALAGVIGTIQLVVTESAAERAADRKRVNEVDEKADLANRKVDRNTDELKAVHSQVNDNTKEIVVLHRNDAVREVELRQLKHAAAEDRRTRKLAAVVFPVLLAVVVGVWLCFDNDAFASSAFSGAMASHVRYIVKLAWMYLVEFVAKVETYWRAFTGNLSFWWFGQA